MHKSIGMAAGLVLAAHAVHAADGLRVAAWNITNYSGGNQTALGTAVYGEFEGRSMNPDVILLQEISSQSAVNQIATALNSVAGSPGTWVAAPLFDNGSINTALVYREDKLDLLASVLVAPGSSSIHPRNVVRYDVQVEGYTGEHGIISLYPTHMKAGSGSTDQQRRLVESNVVLANLATLPAGRAAIHGGDYNIQSSSQAAFRALVGNTYNTGVFRDPINAPGSWNNNGTYRNIHTQDPATQVDDRYDMLLITASLDDGVGTEYIGDPSQPWDLSLYDDPNHSYQCWGNDGSSYNQVLTTTGNQLVGPAIAQAIITLSSGLGHIPVYLDVQVPAVATVGTTLINFGDVAFGQTPAMDAQVGSAGDTALWGSGIEDTLYSFIADSNVIVPVGSFADAAGGALNNHPIQLINTSIVGGGLLEGSFRVTTNDPENPELVVDVVANIVGCSSADLVVDGALNNADINTFVNAFIAMDPAADLNADGAWTNTDINAFVNAFLVGCN